MNDQIDMDDVMDVVLQHYLRHHELVLKKLMLAQKATQISMQEIQEKLTSDPDAIHSVWGEVIEVFADSGLSEDELFSIEEILGRVPKSIKEHYEELVKRDESVQTLMSSINKEEYERAFKIVEEVQAEPNPVSGLTSTDYDDELQGASRKKALINFDSPDSKSWWDKGTSC